MSVLFGPKSKKFFGVNAQARETLYHENSKEELIHLWYVLTINIQILRQEAENEANRKRPNCNSKAVKKDFSIADLSLIQFKAHFPKCSELLIYCSCASVLALGAYRKGTF